jgi:hypothetical protein
MHNRGRLHREVNRITVPIGGGGERGASAVVSQGMHAGVVTCHNTPVVDTPGGRIDPLMELVVVFER